jgi:hypothetical protein
VWPEDRGILGQWCSVVPPLTLGMVLVHGYAHMIGSAAETLGCIIALARTRLSGFERLTNREGCM